MNAPLLAACRARSGRSGLPGPARRHRRRHAGARRAPDAGRDRPAAGGVAPAGAAGTAPAQAGRPVLLDAPGRGVQVAPLTAAGTAAVWSGARRARRAGCRAGRQRREALDTEADRARPQGGRGRNVQAMIEADAAFHSAVHAASATCSDRAQRASALAHIRRAMGAVAAGRHAARRGWTSTRPSPAHRRRRRARRTPDARARRTRQRTHHTPPRGCLRRRGPQRLRGDTA